MVEGVQDEVERGLTVKMGEVWTYFNNNGTPKPLR